MSTTFTIKITSILTHNLNSLEKVIKEINYVITGIQGTQTFSLNRPDPLVIPDADAQNFVPFEHLTESMLLSWIEQHCDKLASLKEHIEQVLKHQVPNNNLIQQSVPWVTP